MGQIIQKMKWENYPNDNLLEKWDILSMSSFREGPEVLSRLMSVEY